MVDEAPIGQLHSPLCPKCGKPRNLRKGDDVDRECHRCRSIDGKIASLHLAIGLRESTETDVPDFAVEEKSWSEARKLLRERIKTGTVVGDKRKITELLGSDERLLEWLIDEAVKDLGSSREDVLRMELSNLPDLAKTVRNVAKTETKTETKKEKRSIPPPADVYQAAMFVRKERKRIEAGKRDKVSKKELVIEYVDDNDPARVDRLCNELKPSRFGNLLKP